MNQSNPRGELPLDACPFCGGCETHIKAATTAPTMNGSSKPYSYDLYHHCPVIEGEPLGTGEVSPMRVWRRTIHLTGKTEKAVVAAWNTRAESASAPLRGALEKVKAKLNEWQPLLNDSNVGDEMLALFFVVDAALATAPEATGVREALKVLPMHQNPKDGFFTFIVAPNGTIHKATWERGAQGRKVWMGVDGFSVGFKPVGWIDATAMCNEARRQIANDPALAAQPTGGEK